MDILQCAYAVNGFNSDASGAWHYYVQYSYICVVFTLMHMNEYEILKFWTSLLALHSRNKGIKIAMAAQMFLIMQKEEWLSCLGHSRQQRLVTWLAIHHIPTYPIMTAHAYCIHQHTHTQSEVVYERMQRNFKYEFIFKRCESANTSS